MIDVRTPVEYREVHVDIARNFSLDQLDPAVLILTRIASANEPLNLICRFESRGKQACEKFRAAGYTNVGNVEGGTQAWEQSGAAGCSGGKALSLERQVRIAAGSIVLIGTLLSYFAHPNWIALPAFIAAGLVFAGITDTCGMGMLLARMPWNQVPKTPPTNTEAVTTTCASKPSTSCCD